MSSPADSPPPELLTALASQGLTLRGARWQLLRGGRSNRLWRMRADGEDLVVKLYRREAATPLFANDPARERLCLAHLQGRFPVPRLRLACTSAVGEAVVYDHVAARAGAVKPAAAGRLMRRLHDLAPPSGLPALADGSDEILAAAEAMLAGVRAPDAARLRASRPAGRVPPSAARCLLHGDVVAANLLDTGAEPVLIDWQCPARGDPCHDLSVYLSPAMRLLYGAPDPDEQDSGEACLAAYGDVGVSARYRALAPFLHYRMAAYCLWRAARGAQDSGEAATREIAALERAVAAPPPAQVGRLHG